MRYYHNEWRTSNDVRCHMRRLFAVESHVTSAFLTLHHCPTSIDADAPFNII